MNNWKITCGLPCGAIGPQGNVIAALAALSVMSAAALGMDAPEMWVEDRFGDESLQAGAGEAKWRAVTLATDAVVMPPPGAKSADVARVLRVRSSGAVARVARRVSVEEFSGLEDRVGNRIELTVRFAFEGVLDSGARIGFGVYDGSKTNLNQLAGYLVELDQAGGYGRIYKETGRSEEPGVGSDLILLGGMLGAAHEPLAEGHEFKLRISREKGRNLIEARLDGKLINVGIDSDGPEEIDDPDGVYHRFEEILIAMRDAGEGSLYVSQVDLTAWRASVSIRTVLFPMLGSALVILFASGLAWWVITFLRASGVASGLRWQLPGWLLSRRAAAASASREVDSILRFLCAKEDCGQKLAVDAEFSGRSIECPNCGLEQLVLAPTEPATEKGFRPMAAIAGLGSRLMPDPVLFRRWRRRLGLVALWGAALALVSVIGLEVAAAYRFNAVVSEICAVGDFRRAPESNHEGSRLVYAQNEENGLGIHLIDLNSLEGKRIDFTQHNRNDDNFAILGWSPDDSRLLIAMPRDDFGGIQDVRIYDGSDGRLRENIQVNGPVREIAWLGDNSVAFVDGLGLLQVLNIEPNPDLGDFGKGGVRRLRQLDDPKSGAVMAISSRIIAYEDGGNVWRLNIPTRKSERLTEFETGGVEWLTYDPELDDFLFCRRADADSDVRRFYRLDPDGSGSQRITQVSNSREHVFKGRWIQGKGVAYVAYVDSRFHLGVRRGKSGPDMRLFENGYAHSFSVSPTGARIYAVAATGTEPPGIWEYDVGASELRLIVRRPAQTFRVSQIARSIPASVVDSNGRTLPYHVWAPVDFDPKKKYPAVFEAVYGSRWSPHAQVFANMGVFYITVDRGPAISSRQWAEVARKLFEVRQTMADNPNIDPERVFITGFSTAAVWTSQLVDEHPELWRGAIFNGPVVLPTIPEPGQRLPRLLISQSEEDALVNNTEEFQQKACR